MLKSPLSFPNSSRVLCIHKSCSQKAQHQNRQWVSLCSSSIHLLHHTMLAFPPQVFPFSLLNLRSTYTPSILDPTPIQTTLRAQGETLRDRLLKVRKIGRIQHVGETQIRIHDIRIQIEEVLADGAEAGVVITESGHKDGGLAVVVELVVDGPLGQDGALVEAERGGLLVREAVLEDEARVHVAAADQGQELRGPRVDVRLVHAARVHEAGRHGHAQVDQRREGFAIGEVALAAQPLAAARVRVRVRGEVVFEPGVGGALLGEQGEAVFGGRGQLELVHEVGGDGGIGGGDGGRGCGRDGGCWGGEDGAGEGRREQGEEKREEGDRDGHVRCWCGEKNDLETNFRKREKMIVFVLLRRVRTKAKPHRIDINSNQ